MCFSNTNIENTYKTDRAEGMVAVLQLKLAHSELGIRALSCVELVSSYAIPCETSEIIGWYSMDLSLMYCILSTLRMVKQKH